MHSRHTGLWHHSWESVARLHASHWHTSSGLLALHLLHHHLLLERLEHHKLLVHLLLVLLVLLRGHACHHWLLATHRGHSTHHLRRHTSLHLRHSLLLMGWYLLLLSSLGLGWWCLSSSLRSSLLLRGSWGGCLSFCECLNYFFLLWLRLLGRFLLLLFSG
jgi:hypothetical protein